MRRESDPFMSLSPETLEIVYLQVQLLRIGRIGERRSPQDEVIYHPVYQLIGIWAEPGTVVGVNSHITSQWFNGCLPDIHSINREMICYICERDNQPYAIIEVQTQDSATPWTWYLRRVLRQYASCMLGYYFPEA